MKRSQLFAVRRHPPVRPTDWLRDFVTPMEVISRFWPNELTHKVMGRCEGHVTQWRAMTDSSIHNRAAVTAKLYRDVLWRLVNLHDPVSYLRTYLKSKIQSCMGHQWVDAWRGKLIVLWVQGCLNSKLNHNETTLSQRDHNETTRLHLDVMWRFLCFHDPTS